MEGKENDERWRIKGKVEDHHYVLFAVGITSIGEMGLHLFFHVSHFTTSVVNTFLKIPRNLIPCKQTVPFALVNTGIEDITFHAING